MNGFRCDIWLVILFSGLSFVPCNEEKCLTFFPILNAQKSIYKSHDINIDGASTRAK